MKNNGQGQMSKRLRKILALPVSGIRFFNRTIREKLEFSIRFKLSVNFLKIFIKAMVLAGLGIFFIFGASNIFLAVQGDYTALENFLETEMKAPVDHQSDHQRGGLAAEEGEVQSSLSRIKEFAAKEDLPLMVYDQSRSRTLILATDPTLANDGFPRLIGVVGRDKHTYLAVNRDSINRLRSSPLLRFFPFFANQNPSSIPLPYTLVSYTDLGPVLTGMIRLAKIMLVVGTLVFLLSLISIAMIGRGFFQPIKEMTQTVRDISERNLNLRLNVSGSKDELKELAMTFNEMMNRIENNYNRQKQFVSDASHELRTPIAVIQGYADMLDRWGKDDREVLQESIDAIKNEGENMKELIDKLLFLARHDKENFVLQKEEFNLTEVLQEIAKETQIIDDTHKISFDIQGQGEARICADKNRIKQAIRIFIDNALKYTPPGGEIAVTLGRTEDFWTISIKDSGIGMTGEELEHIFDRFYRSEASRTKEKGGHGLGLAIAKIIILGHQGKIKVKSRPGMGSEFIIFLK
ncbi:sensor histidine kinase [Dehalobacterium formicoaceticum]|uniref:sensor histidine kinase n=1 Tax=Dehalobacterium formicoaceticum TaxID=51515 RepID=UPI001FA842DA|nr:ATP-binding protein [Dehalobacterium formicoaceticum]